jgi:hypothetical protein
MSRNKDNKDVPNFKPRVQSFLYEEGYNTLMEKFDKFVADGVPHEFCRLYVGVNAVDEQKVKKELAKFLVDEAFSPSDWSLLNLNNKVVSLASLSCNKKEKKWLFDCDVEDDDAFFNFRDDVEEYGGEVVDLGRTPNGYFLVTARGFDTRKLMEKYPLVELKKDAMKCLHWETKEG